VSDIQRKLQAALDSIKENDFHGALEAWKKRRDCLYVHRETILKQMAAKIKQVKPAFSYLVQELPNTPHIKPLIPDILIKFQVEKQLNFY
jgi:hypothetical protein